MPDDPKRTITEAIKKIQAIRSELRDALNGKNLSKLFDELREENETTKEASTYRGWVNLHDIDAIAYELKVFTD